MKNITFLFISIFLIFMVSLNAKGLPKEYYKIKDINKSKQYFFKYLYTLVKNENIKILNEKALVENILNSNLLTINFNSPSFLQLLEIKKKYRISNLYSINEYRQKIDIIPPSLAIAQAAVESGWGKSRFIKEANNIFGHWTYNPKIGMLPEERAPEARHYIRIFKTMQDSISAYMLNLNRNLAYKEFQNKRYNLRKENKKPDGLILSQTMLKYSGIGHEYLAILKQVINKNKLLDFDTKFNKEIQTK